MLLQNQRANNSPLGRALSIAVLALALVGAQIAGVAHRIEHPPGSDSHRTQRLALLQHDCDCDDDVHSHDGEHAPEHDCSAYDAATLGDGPPIVRSEPSAASSPKPTPTAAGNAVTDNSPHLPFHSRAPPRA